jgi:hypothetical protein
MLRSVFSICARPYILHGLTMSILVCSSLPSGLVYGAP